MDNRNHTLQMPTYAFHQDSAFVREVVAKVSNWYPPAFLYHAILFVFFALCRVLLPLFRRLPTFLGHHLRETTLRLIERIIPTANSILEISVTETSNESPLQEEPMPPSRPSTGFLNTVTDMMLLKNPLIAVLCSQQFYVGCALHCFMNGVTHEAFRRAAVIRPVFSLLFFRLPILAVAGSSLVKKISILLRVIRCQTSFAYSQYRRKSAFLDTSLSAMPMDLGGFVYRFSTALMERESDVEACNAVGMIQPSYAGPALGSRALLQSMLKTQVIVYIANRLFEHEPLEIIDSQFTFLELCMMLAEADFGLLQKFGITFPRMKSRYFHTFVDNKHPSYTQFASLGKAVHGEAGFHQFSTPSKFSELLDTCNVPVSYHWITLISTSSMLSFLLLDNAGMLSRLRFVCSAFWTLCQLATLVLGLWNPRIFAGEDGSGGLPVIFIMKYLPLLFILVGVGLCLMVQAIVFCVLMVSGSRQRLRCATFRKRFNHARKLMRSYTVSTSFITFKWSDDFSYFLYKFAKRQLLISRNSLFFHEGKSIVARPRTWLENQRLTQFKIYQYLDHLPQNDEAESAQRSVEDIMMSDIDVLHNDRYRSPYGHQMSPERIRLATVFGGFQPSLAINYLLQAYVFCTKVGLILLGWVSILISHTSKQTVCHPSKMNESKPRSRSKSAADHNHQGAPSKSDASTIAEECSSQEELLLLGHEPDWSQIRDQTVLEEQMYAWFLAGGNWSDDDSSGDYLPSGPDDTSEDLVDQLHIIPLLNHTDSENEDDDDLRGPSRSVSRESNVSPNPATFKDDNDPEEYGVYITAEDNLLNFAALSSLLHPRDETTAQEAHILAAHLLPSSSTGRIMTRSRFNTYLQIHQARAVTSNTFFKHGPQPTLDEEVAMLEDLLHSKRASAGASISAVVSDHKAPVTPIPHGARARTTPQGKKPRKAKEKMDDTLHLCSICMNEPRSVVFWPCCCLLVGEKCRADLESRGFLTCVACQRRLSGYLTLDLRLGLA